MNKAAINTCIQVFVNESQKGYAKWKFRYKTLYTVKFYSYDSIEEANPQCQKLDQ